MKVDKCIENLLELDGQSFVLDEILGLWVKFEAKAVARTEQRPHGIRYSFSLHDRLNNRIMGFDNAHAIEYGSKTKVAPKRIYDHWHKSHLNEVYPYFYEDAAKLLEDFWNEVNKILVKLKELNR